MNRILRIIAIIILVLFPAMSQGQNIFRFDHIGSEEGLSQNTGFSILFDSKGFMWIGTMNGLNRYDGYEFEIFRSSHGNPSSFTNNRVTKLWEDKRGFIWLETYDGYYHFFNPVTEIFHSIPLYEGSDVHNGAMKFFLQHSDDIILLGSSESGLYLLKYDGTEKAYAVQQFTDEGINSLSDNRIKFLQRDSENNVWIGTQNGTSFIPGNIIGKRDPTISRKYTELSFTSVCETSGEIWFGTEENGIMVYDKPTGNSRMISVQTVPGFKSDKITHLYRTRTGEILAGFRNKGLMITQNSGKEWQNVKFHSENLDKIYEDRHNQVWLTAVEFGVTRLDMKSLDTRFYVLTPEEIKPLTDLERPQFFEDTHDKLAPDYVDISFRRCTFSASDSTSIGNNNIYSVCEDKMNSIWIGTYGNGLSLALNPGEKDLKFIRINQENSNLSSDLIRHLLVDSSGNLWVATTFGLNLLEKRILNQATTDSRFSLRIPLMTKALYTTMLYTSLKIQRKGSGLEPSEEVLTCLKGMMGRALLSGIMAPMLQSVTELYTGYLKTGQAKYGSAPRMVLYAWIPKLAIQKSITMLMAWDLTAFPRTLVSGKETENLCSEDIWDLKLLMLTDWCQNKTSQILN